MDESKTDKSERQDVANRHVLYPNKEMLPCKLLFLTMDTGFTSAFAFTMLFYKTAGLPLTQIGLGKGIVDIFAMMSNTFWGGFLDSVTKQRTLLFTTLSLLSAGMTFFTPWLLMFIRRTTTAVKCLGNSTVHNVTLFSHVSDNCTSIQQLENVGEVFLVMTSYGVVSTIINAGLYCFIEGTVIKAVFTSKSKQSYGQQRMFGSIGNAFGNFIAGVIVDLYRPKYLPRFSGAYFISIPFFLFIIPLLYILTKRTSEENIKNDEEKKASFMKNVITVFKKQDNFVFILSVFIAGLSFTVYSNFMFVFMDEVMKTTKTLMSLSAVVSTLSELVFYPLSSRIIKLVGGPLRCISLCMLVYSLRLTLLSFSSKTWYIIVIQLLHGVSTSLSWTAMVEHAWEIFPTDATNTAIGILISVHFTGSSIIGNILGGYLYFKFKGFRLFRGMAIISLTWGIFMLFYFEILRRRRHTEDMSYSVEKGIDNEADIEMEEE